MPNSGVARKNLYGRMAQQQETSDCWTRCPVDSGPNGIGAKVSPSARGFSEPPSAIASVSNGIPPSVPDAAATDMAATVWSLSRGTSLLGLLNLPLRPDPLQTRHNALSQAVPLELGYRRQDVYL